jgi:hypothetical protein
MKKCISLLLRNRGEQQGHPLKGVSREKTPLPEKILLIFLLGTMFPTARC